MRRTPSFLGAALVGLVVGVSAVTAEAQTSGISLGSMALNVADIINSTDARALAERTVAARAKMLKDVGQPGGPVLLFLSDPDGYEFELGQLASGGE
jgi:hypothetical protein